MARTKVLDDTAIIDFTHRQGKTFRRGIRWTKDPASGEAFDPTGWTARMMLRLDGTVDDEGANEAGTADVDEDTDDTAALTLTTENNRIVLQAPSLTADLPEDTADYTEVDYHIIIVIEATAVAGLAVADYLYDLELVGPADVEPGPEPVVHCPIAGKFKLTLEYTK
mgnify:CR=1 FL=1